MVVDEISYLVLSCVFEPLEQFSQRVRECLGRLHRSTWQFSRGPLDIRQVYYPRPQAGGAKPMRVVMWAPRSRPDSTVFYPNSADGWATLIARLSFEGMPDCISVRSTQVLETWSVQEVHFIGRGDQTKRMLQLIKEEDGIKFYEQGVPFAFEDLSVKPKDRVNSRDGTFDFVARLGLDLRDSNFWATDEEAHYLAEERNPSPVMSCSG